MHLVIVTGGRDFLYPQIVYKALSDQLRLYGPFTLYHGACKRRGSQELTGADRYADDWGNATDGVEVVPFPADEDFACWGKRGGPIRNRRMVSTAVLATSPSNIQGLAFPAPGSTGTYNCMSIMRDFHILVDVWTPDRVHAELAAMARGTGR